MATDWNAVSAFMANVVAWPGSSQDPGFCNLHYSMPSRTPTPERPLAKGMGWPFKDVTKFVERAAWINTVPAKFKDVWFCTSLQSKAGTNTQGKPKAIRLAANAVNVKALWVDIDVGPAEPGKKPKYETIEIALRAILAFQVAVGLPAPSAIVYSGGGIHVYWISKVPLAPDEWYAYADGLKQLLLANNILCDTGLTTDIARLLRVPGTSNFKYNPPKPVTLAPLPLVMYDFPSKMAFLQKFAGPVAAAHRPAHALFADGVDPTLFTAPHPAFDALKGTPDLNAGIDKFSDTLLEPFPIFKNCGFMRQGLTTGGKDYDQTLWMYSVLCSTFMEDGNDIAHRISQGHASYSQADTQALYDRKMAERVDRGIGYPSCATIAGAGCKSCASCPLFAKGKSPLNIRPEPVTAAVNPAVQSAGAKAAGLPNGFELNNHGIICKVIETEEDGDVNTGMVPLFQCIMTDFWLGKHPGEQVNFTMTVDKGFTEQANVDLGEISSQGFLSYLGKRRVLIDPKATIKMIQEFFLSTIGQLRALAAAQHAVPFGWYDEDGKRRGFVFDGRIMLDDGTERPCGPVDPNTQRKYKPSGTMENWLKAANTVIHRQRPELTTIFLMSFASPLLTLAGNKNSMMLAAYGTDSGAGKSSAYTAGMSVWGHPLLTKGTQTSTVNGITNTMKVIRNLPFYWDEITNDDMREKVANVMHEADGGREKSRMKDGQNSQEEGTWKLMLHYASNGSFVSFLRGRNQNTVASVVRVLEWEVKRFDGGPGQMLNADAEALLDLANSNYGHMGVKYAKFLALNHVQIQAEVHQKCVEVQKTVRGGDTERFWYTTVALMAMAAKYARMMGLEIDPAAIETFMYKVYNDNLVMRDEFFGTGGNVDNSETVLTRYFKDREAQERLVWSNYMHNQQGRPPKPVTILKGPTQARNNIGGVEVRFAVENKICVISKTDFNAWLKEFKHSDAQIYSALKTTYAMTQQRLQICSGWVHDAGREDCLVLQVRRGTPLWNFMLTYLSVEERERMEAEGDLAEPPVDTGLTVDPATGLATASSVAAVVKGATAHA